MTFEVFCGCRFDGSGPYHQSTYCLIQGTFNSELLDSILRKVPGGEWLVEGLLTTWTPLEARGHAFWRPLW